MSRFLVIPKTASGGRFRLYEVIDTAPPAAGGQDRWRIGTYANEQMAHGLAATLNGAAAVYDAEVSKLQNNEPF